MATLQRYMPGGIVNWNQGNVREFPEAASQSFKAGDPVDLVSGKLTLAVAAGNNFGAGDDIVGVALEDASGTTNTRIKVYVFNANTILRLPVYHSTAASAITAYTQIGTSYEIRFHTGSILCVDIENTTNAKGKVIGINEGDPRNPVGEQYGLVDFIWDPAQLAFPNT